MSHGIVSVCGWLSLLFAVSVTASCSNDGNPSQSSSAGRADSADLRLESQGIDERDVLRIRKDALRNRLWVLTLENVQVYDIARKRKKLIRQIALPNWFVAPFDFACMPDMALDRLGSAFISSNVQPRLWRIDADSFELKEHEISLHGREWDVGFGALTFAADGTLIALTSLAGSLWKIDVATANATMIDPTHPPSNVCDFTTQFLNDLTRG